MESVEYREIPGYPGHRAGDDGTIWSNRVLGRPHEVAKYWRLLPVYVSKGGYLRVKIGGRLASVHRLILSAFVGPCPEGLLALHGDGNCKNNRPSNLRWGTQKENVADSIKHGTNQHGERGSRAKLTDSQIKQIRRRIASGETTVAVAREFGIHQGTASRIASGVNWKHLLKG